MASSSLQPPTDDSAFVGHVEDVAAELKRGMDDAKPSAVWQGRRGLSRSDVVRISYVEDSNGVVRIVHGGARSALPTSVRRGRGDAFALRTIATQDLPTLGKSQVYEVLERLDRKLTEHVSIEGISSGFRELKLNAPGSKKKYGMKPVVGPLAQGKILLIVHGTFSNCDKLLDDMCETPEGLVFLKGAAARYDQILAFDHRTLGVSPMLNARELALWMNASKASVDIICHSRGGLVARWWAETMDRNAGRARRIVFVGSPMSGTGLAAPPNIRAAMALLASISKALAGLSASVPFLGVATVLAQIAGSITSLAAKTPIADAAIALVPGLDAMSRIANNHELLSQHAAWDATSGASYYAIKSNFETDNPGWRFWRVFRNAGDRIKDLATDAIFDGENDLVVDTSSMNDFGGKNLIPPLRCRDFGTTDSIHHVNYFTQKKTMDQLGKWLL